jgi:hypothetical protein
MSIEYKIGKFLQKEILYPNKPSSNSHKFYSLKETNEKTLIASKITLNEISIKSIDKDKLNLLDNLSDNEKIFIASLIPIEEEGNSSKEIFDCSKLNLESEEYKFYNAIGRVVHQIMHKKLKINCEYYKNLNNTCEISHENIDKLINKEKLNNKKLEFIAIKSIIISFTSFISELIKNYINMIENEIDDYDNEDDYLSYIFLNSEIFNIIYIDFESNLDNCKIIEKDFMKSLNNFREKYQMSFNLNQLYTDIFWNCIFHKKIFCNAFIYNFKLDKRIEEIFNLIIKALFELQFPLKRQISELLGIRNKIEINEKSDLISIIMKQKQLTNNGKFQDCLNYKINDFIQNKIKPLTNEIGISTEIENNINLYDNNNNINSLDKIQFDCEQIKEDINLLKNNNNEKETNINKMNDEINNEKIDNNLKPTLKESNKNISLDNKTIDEIFDYINSDTNEKSKNKKKHKKKNKKCIIEESLKENNDYELDPIVEQFKNEITISNLYSNNQKIKPVISSDWLTSISLKSY